MAPRVLEHPGTRPTERKRETVDTNILRKDHPGGRNPTDETPHGCYSGWVLARQ